MNESLPTIYLARHGETAWSLTSQHTGLTDLPLTETGERNAQNLGERLRGLKFVKVFTSPLQRAVRTCELAGFKPSVEIDNDLVEWNYGDYEGRRTIEIRAERPDWQLFRDGCPGGESPEQVAARADRVVARVRAIADDANGIGNKQRFLCGRKRRDWKSFALRTCETKSASVGICALSSRKTAGSVQANMPAFQR